MGGEEARHECKSLLSVHYYVLYTWKHEVSRMDVSLMQITLWSRAEALSCFVLDHLAQMKVNKEQLMPPESLLNAVSR